MGFVNYHGDKQDNYDAIIELADENKRIQAEKNRKKMQADFFGVRELAELDTRDILIQLALHFRKIRNQHNEIISKSRGNDFDDRQTFTDLWLFSISSLLNQSALSLEKKIKITDQLISKAFQLDPSINALEHYAYIDRLPLYSDYLTDSFDGKAGKLFYWHWMAGLDKADQSNVETLYANYLLIYRILAFYLNQVFPEQGIGIKALENWEEKERKYKHKLCDNRLPVNPAEKLINPLYKMEGIKAVDSDAVNKYSSFVNAYSRYKRIIVGGSMNLDDNLLIGALYKNYNSGDLADEKVPSILPEKCRELLAEGLIPIISDEEASHLLEDDESLHYIENAISLIPLDNKGSKFQSLHGKVYLTDRKIIFKSMSSIYRITSEDLERVVLYDSNPDIVEIVGGDKRLLIRSANTVETYEFLKRINIVPYQDHEELMNLEKLSTEDFRKDSFEAYIFSLNELSDADLPDEMKTALIAVKEAIQALVNALTQYPSEVVQSHKFKDYYIPEIISLTNSYIEYNKAGVGNKVIGPVYTKIMNSLADVEAAAKQRINEIYQVATMGTQAKAEALQRVLGQDGYN